MHIAHSDFRPFSSNSGHTMADQINVAAEFLHHNLFGMVALTLVMAVSAGYGLRALVLAPLVALIVLSLRSFDRTAISLGDCASRSRGLLNEPSHRERFEAQVTCAAHQLLHHGFSKRR